MTASQLYTLTLHSSLGNAERLWSLSRGVEYSSAAANVPFIRPAPVKLQRVSADDTEAQEAAVRVMEEAFYPRESACLGCGVADSPQAVRELSDLVRDALKDGVSVAAYLGDAMVGVAELSTRYR